MWVALLSEWELADFGDIFRALLEPGSQLFRVPA
jgi:hypothetical protein